MKKIVYIVLCIFVHVTVRAQSSSTKDERLRSYIDLSKSVKSTATFKGKPMMQFLVSKYTISANKKDTTFINLLLWVEAEAGQEIIDAKRAMWIEPSYVKWYRGGWMEVKNPTTWQLKKRIVICKIFNFGTLFPIPDGSVTPANAGPLFIPGNQNNDGGIQLPGSK